MSASKCGNPYAVVLPIPSPPKDPEVIPEPTLSRNATQILKKIQARFPDFDPLSESAIWLKARSMGLTEEE